MRRGAFAALLACGSANAAGPAGTVLDDLFGAPFTGKVVATIRQPGSSPQGRAETGSGSARFVDTGAGRMRLVVVGNVRKPSDTGFDIEGVTSSSGWRGESGGWSLTIASDGTISGGGIEAQHRLSFAGKAAAERISLRVETELLQANARGLPAGSVIAFDYQLLRPATRRAAEASASQAPGKKTCKRTVWQVRNVTTPLGGMQMVRVPVCVN